MSYADQEPMDYQARLGLRFAPSRYQLKIWNWIRSGRGNGVVDAVAGAGKSTTAVCSAALMEGEGLFCAFNKEIADELERRLEGTSMVASTVHRHGLRCLRFFSYARIGLGGRVQVKVDDEEKKYATMFAKAAEAVLRRAEEHDEILRRAKEEEAHRRRMDGLEVKEQRTAEVDLDEPNSALCGSPVSRRQVAVITEQGFPISECVDLTRLCRLFLVDFDGTTFEAALDDIADRFDIDVDEQLWPLVVIAVRNALQLGCEIPESGEWLVDFTDMLWLPVVLGLRPKQYDWVIVDECQDISTAARRLLMASVKRRGRMLWIGDPCQAINGFAGADDESFEAIVKETRAQILRLSVCYRCPTSHLAIAQQWRSDIEARDGAPSGTIARMERSEYVDVAKRGDLVICRRTAPLVQLCFELIAAGTSANVRGRADVSKGLLKIVKRASRLAPGGLWSDSFKAGLEAFETAEVEKIKRRARTEQARDNSIDALRDRVECVRIIWRSTAAQSAGALSQEIERIFADKDAAVMLSTVHRAKGLEADRVAILEFDRLMSVRATQPWQIKQEENLAYVAYTRSKSELIEIPAPKRGEA